MPRSSVLLGVLAAALLLTASFPVAAGARPQMRSVFEDDCLLIQLSPDRYCQRASRERTLDTIRSLGADVIRFTVMRDKVEQYGFGPFDAAIDGTVAHGMAPLLSLTDRLRTPTPRQFAAFAHQMAARYPEVHLWSLYNEPNLLYWLRSRSPGDYRNLVVAAQAAIRGVPNHRRDTILIGELAPHVTANKGTAVGPLRFLRGLFCLDARLRPLRGRSARPNGCTRYRRFTADGLAIHPYTKAALKPPTWTDSRDGYDVSSLGRVTRIIDAAARAGRTNRMNLWNTEMGFQSRPPQPQGPSLARQAEYINWGDWIQYRNPRVATVAQFLLQDGPFVKDVSFNTGLVAFRGRRKPAFDAYRLGVFVARSGRGSVQVWTNARPGGAARVTIQRQTRGRGPFRAVARVRTNGSGYVERRLRGGPGDRWRVRWSSLTSRIAVLR